MWIYYTLLAVWLKRAPLMIELVEGPAVTVPEVRVEDRPVLELLRDAYGFLGAARDRGDLIAADRWEEGIDKLLDRLVVERPELAWKATSGFAAG